MGLHSNCHSKQISKETVEEMMMAFAPFGLSEPWLVEYQPVFQLPMNIRQLGNFHNSLKVVSLFNELGQWLLELRNLDCRSAKSVS